LPIPAAQLQLLPLLADIQTFPNAKIGDVECRVFKATPKPDARSNFNLRRFALQLWVREFDSFPLRVEYTEPNGVDAQIELVDPQFTDPWPAEKWKLQPAKEDKIETVASAHLAHFFSVALSTLDDQIPTLSPAIGERRVLAREGNGRLEMIDGTRVLVLKGTPEEMGHQHGKLLKTHIRDLMDHILFGVGVGSSFQKGRWFFGEIEAAQQHLSRFLDKRYLREMDALADAAGVQREEVRLGNFFPELFHCSGFAIFGKATQDGRMYHGRVLDYMRGLGLEQHAVVMVLQPERGNAWVNVSYAGFIGSVTAMNEKHIAIGEMGGRGEARWDGKPMAELVREVMETANTLDEAIEIMRRGPRTCEYYYVISDAKSKRAVGIAATPDKFETISPGQGHPLLRHPIKDAVLLSAGERYEELVNRVQANYGKFDAQSSIDLMKRPVCMPSNLHCALFEPDSLDFWVANADAQNVAADTRFTRYNLVELMRDQSVGGTKTAGK
jgi:isopenicillin-N N-acyltransferase-like protein